MTLRTNWLWRSAAVIVAVACVATPLWPQDQEPQNQAPQAQAPQDQAPQAQAPPAPAPQQPQAPSDQRPPSAAGPRRGMMGGPGMRGPNRGGPGRVGRPTPPLPGAPNAPGATAPGNANPAGALPPLGAAPGAPAKSNTPEKLKLVEQNGQKTIEMQFYDLGLDHFLRFLSTAANVTIIRDQNLGDVTVTVVTPEHERFTLESAFQILNSILQARDYSLVEMGPSLYMIQPLIKGYRSTKLPVHVGAIADDVEQSSTLITQVIPLVNLSAQEVAGEIAPLLSQTTTPTIIQSTNSLIVTDTAGNVNRALQVIQHLEGELAGGLQPIHLRYRDASEVAGLVQTLIFNRGGGGAAMAGPRPVWERGVVGGGGAAGQGRPVPTAQQMAASIGGSGGGEFVFPDTRTNTLFVQATPTHLQQVQDLVAQLDKPISLKDSVYIYPAQNLGADDLANLVGPLISAKVSVVGQGATGAPGQTGQRGGATGNRAGQRGNQGLRTGGSAFGGGGGYGGYGGNPFGRMGGYSVDPTAAANPAQPAQPVEVEPLAAPSTGAHDGPLQVAQADGGPPQMVMPQPPVPIGESGMGGDEGQIYSPSASTQEPAITADTTTNTLLITASPEQLELLKGVLEKLDVMPPQVYIQAIIVEVQKLKKNSLGFQWDNLTSQFKTSGGQTFNGVFDTNFGLRNDKGEVIHSPGGLTGVITEIGGFEAILSALASDTNAKVLSTPGIFTANNQPANITIATEEPFPNGQTITSNGNVITNITSRTIGIELDVTPRVTQGDIVQLDVDISADEAGGEVNVGGQVYPSFLRREASALVNIKDGNTVILGGLMRDNATTSTSKVPVLGDIPLLGALFRSRSTNKEKSELLVFLTPRVVRSAAEAQQLSESQRDTLPAIPRSLNRPLDQQGLQQMESPQGK